MTSIVDAIDSDATQAVLEELLDILPEPVGPKILIVTPTIEEKTTGGIIKPVSAVHREEVASTVGMVVKIGPDAFKDEKRFPSGPWCKVGDFVITRAYSGTRGAVKGKEFRIIYDDQIDGVAPTVEGYGRAY